MAISPSGHKATSLGHVVFTSKRCNFLDIQLPRDRGLQRLGMEFGQPEPDPKENLLIRVRGREVCEADQLDIKTLAMLQCACSIDQRQRAAPDARPGQKGPRKLIDCNGPTQKIFTKPKRSRNL